MPTFRQRFLLPVLLASITSACTGASVNQSRDPDGLSPAPDVNVDTGSPSAAATTPGAVASSPGAVVSSKPGVAKPSAAASNPAGLKPTTPAKGWPSAGLYSGAADTQGITGDKVVMCAHAALTYADAFQTKPEDYNVYWSAVNDAGGVHGRRVDVTYENDNYTAAEAITASTKCQAKNPFVLLSGFGFDQIPAVRNWAEQNKALYLHHAATVEGSQGKRFSFSAVPTVEKLGDTFADVAVSRFTGKRIGILHRDSVNWDPGYKAFLAAAKKRGLNVVYDGKVQNQQANYTAQIVALKNDAKADVVWLWENALATTEILTQAKSQAYNPTWLVFPFNLTSQSVGQTGPIAPPWVGVAAWPAYSKGDYSGGFSSYASDIKLFEQQYAKYRPNTDLSSVGGDLLFLTWVGHKTLHQMLLDCGANCTRNTFAGMMLSGYQLKVQGCAIDWRRNPHVGGFQVNVFETYLAPGNKWNWRPTQLCREHPS